MAQNLKKSMVLDGIAASEAVDSSGEKLSIKGLDISSLEEGTGVLNYEHRGDQSEGASANDVIGHITFAKKIFSEKDCENDRELSYWSKVQLPFVYIQAELFDGEGHPGAVAAAALIRYYHRRKMPLLMRYSIEGSTLERDGNTLKRCIARRVAATIKPCNRSCYSGVLSDSGEESKSKSDGLEDLIRHESPTRKRLGGTDWMEVTPVSDPLDTVREGIEQLREMNDLNKAFAIGGGLDAAPTSLTQGAALAASSFDGEKRKKFIKNQAQAALRDWAGKGDLKKFLKHRLPDASEEFIGHFANLVEDYRMKKAMELEDNLLKAVNGEPAATPGAPAPAAPKKSKWKDSERGVQKAPKEEKVEDDETESLEEVEKKLGSAPLTFRGSPVAASNTVKGFHFDHETGTLHTPRGSFKMYLPQHDQHDPGAMESFMNILNGPKITALHDYATDNWYELHKLAKTSSLPPEVVMHATLFSQLSPNTPVPMQELMYSHLVDAMKRHGIDARDPRFAGLKQDWMSRDRPDQLPEHGHEYFETGAGAVGVHLKHNAYVKTWGVNTKGKPGYVNKLGPDGKPIIKRPKGSVASFMLANNKFKNMEQYHTLHDALVKLVNYHGIDGRSAAAELMKHKHKAALHEAQRERNLKAGKGDIGPYMDGPAVPGLAPKTGRYTLAMLGAGNIHVPDTHFTRYLFGLEKGTDDRAIKYLKTVLWNDSNAHILDAIDKYYAEHHPAVEHMAQHKTYGPLFLGNREQLIFPAFWKNWVAIAEHERARKMKTMAFNEATDHKPLWHGIQPYVPTIKFEDEHAMNVAQGTAQTHAKWVEQYGRMPALHMYYMYLLPQLMRANRNAAGVPIQKFEKIATKLRKAAEALAQPAPEPQLPPLDHNKQPAHVHRWGGQHIIPGEVEVVGGPHKGSKLHFLGRFQQKIYVKAKDGVGDIQSLPVADHRKLYRINSHPRVIQMPEYVDGTLHADPALNKTFEQRSLMHGINLSDRASAASSGLTAGQSDTTGWYKNHAGIDGFVKPDIATAFDWNDPDAEYVKAHETYPLPHREAMMHNMAREFFGMGEHVPVTSVFAHPKTGKPHSVMQKVLGGYHYHHSADYSDNHLMAMHKTGQLDKVNLMDLMMGNVDRHDGNYMFADKGANLHLIDNGLMLDFKTPSTSDAYRSDLWYKQHRADGSSSNPRNTWRQEAIHPEATKWMMSLDPKQYAAHLAAHGVPPVLIKHGGQRMMAFQLAAMQAQSEGRQLTRHDILNTMDTLIHRQLGR